MTNPNPTCPDCGSKRLTLTVTQLVDVTFDGEDHEISDGPRGDIEWTNDTAAVCDCGWCGDISEAKPRVVFQAEWHEAIDQMRRAGFAVVVFSPDEMGDDVDARNLEGSLVERGNNIIGSQA